MNYKFMLQKNKYRFSYNRKMLVISEENIINRKKEISFFLKELSLYGISLKNIVEKKPNNEVKNLLLNMAYAIIKEDSIINKIRTSRSLPIKEVSKFTHESSMLIEKWENYLLAYILLLCNTAYLNIQSYLNIEYNEENHYSNTSDSNSENQNLKATSGMVLKIDKKLAYIITSYGDFLKIKINSEEFPEVGIGDLISGKTHKNIKFYKFPILMCVFSLILIIFLSFSIYNQSHSSIVIEMNGSIKIQLNRFNKVVSYSSTTSTLKKITNAVAIDNKNMDESIFSILKYAKDNEIIKKGSTIYLYVNGINIKEDNFKTTEDYIIENKLDVRINNNGKEYRINKNK